MYNLDCEVEDRLRRTLYYGRDGSVNGPSLPLTELVVQIMNGIARHSIDSITVDDAARISESMRVSPCAMMLGLLYAKRLKQANSPFLTAHSSAELFLITMIMASKFMFDEGEDEEIVLSEWAEEVNLNKKDLVHMERQFINAMDWNLFVGSRDFTDFLSEIEASVALTQGGKRGWFTYAEMAAILDQPLEWRQYVSQFGTVFLSCLVSYLMCSAYLMTSSNLTVMLLHTALRTPISDPTLPESSVFASLPQRIEPHLSSHGVPVLSNQSHPKLLCLSLLGCRNGNLNVPSVDRIEEKEQQHRDSSLTQLKVLSNSSHCSLISCN